MRRGTQSPLPKNAMLILIEAYCAVQGISTEKKARRAAALGADLVRPGGWEQLWLVWSFHYVNVSKIDLMARLGFLGGGGFCLLLCPAVRRAALGSKGTETQNRTQCLANHSESLDCLFFSAHLVIISRFPRCASRTSTAQGEHRWIYCAIPLLACPCSSSIFQHSHFRKQESFDNLQGSPCLSFPYPPAQENDRPHP